jgi:hypothetical protein
MASGHADHAEARKKICARAVTTEDTMQQKVVSARK